MAKFYLVQPYANDEGTLTDAQVVSASALPQTISGLADGSYRVAALAYASDYYVIGSPVAEEVERVVNGTFDTDITGWTLDASPTVSVTGGVVSITSPSGLRSILQDVPVDAGSPHRFYLPNISNGTIYLYDGAGFTTLLRPAINSGNAVQFDFTPTANVARLRLAAVNGTATFDNLSIKKLTNNPKASYPWANLPWAAMGDSLTAQGTWQPIPVGDFVLRMSNFGVGGSKVAGGAASAMWQDARVNLLPTTARLVTVLGFTNDWVQSTPLGTIDGTDTNTFYGALNVMHSKIAARCPLARIAYISAPYSEMLDPEARGWPNGYTNAIGLTIGDYAEAMRLWTAANGHALFDVNALCGINAGNITTYMTNDGNLIHPNAAGGALIGAVVSNGIRGLLPL